MQVFLLFSSKNLVFSLKFIIFAALFEKKLTFSDVNLCNADKKVPTS